MRDICSAGERQSIIPYMINFKSISNAFWELCFSGMFFLSKPDTYYTFIKRYDIDSAQALCEQLSAVFSANEQETRYPKILVGDRFTYIWVDFAYDVDVGA